MNKNVGHYICYEDEESDKSSGDYSNVSQPTKYLRSSLSESCLITKDRSYKSLEHVSSSDSDLLKIYSSSKYENSPYGLPEEQSSDFEDMEEKIITTDIIYENKEFNDYWKTEESDPDLIRCTNLLTSSLSESNLFSGGNLPSYGSSNCLLLASSESELSGTKSNMPYYISSSNYLSLRHKPIPPHSSTSQNFISKQYGGDLPYMNENNCLEEYDDEYPTALILEENDPENQANAFVMYNNTSFRVHSSHSSDCFDFSTNSIQVNDEKEIEEEYYDAKSESSVGSYFSLGHSSFVDDESTSDNLYFLPDDKNDPNLKMLSNFDPNLYLLYENPNFGINSPSSSEGTNLSVKLEFSKEESEDEYCDAQSELEATSYRSHLTLSPPPSAKDMIIPNFLFHLPEDDIVRPELELILENFTFRSSGSENDSDVKYDTIYKYSSNSES